MNTCQPRNSNKYVNSIGKKSYY